MHTAQSLTFNFPLFPTLPLSLARSLTHPNSVVQCKVNDFVANSSKCLICTQFPTVTLELVDSRDCWNYIHFSFVILYSSQQVFFIHQKNKKEPNNVIFEATLKPITFEYWHSCKYEIKTFSFRGSFNVFVDFQTNKKKNVNNNNHMKKKMDYSKR